MDALRTNRIGITFGGVTALSGVTLSLRVGERHCIIGPNGAGKTTLFNLITGVLRPTIGQVFLFDKDITNYPTHLRPSMGLARTFQITNLFPNLSVMENIYLGIQARRWTKYVFYRRTTEFRDIIDSAGSLLQEWGLWKKRNYPVSSLSHGEQRQLEIILAMSSQPKVLLLDEPTQGLSIADTRLVVPLVESMDRSTSILFIEHDMDVAFKLADRITVLHYGVIIAEGTEAEIRGNSKVAEVYLGVETHA